jgi:hypothetical protein
MNSQQTALQVFRKARTLAQWSYIGVLLPLLGVILGLVSRSMLKTLNPTNDKEISSVSSAKRVAGWGIAVSVVMFLVWSGLGSWGLSVQREAERQEALAQEQERQAMEDANKAATDNQAQRYLQQMNLNECLDSVDKWVAENNKQVTTIYQEQNLLQAKQQEVEECKLRYPVD